ncbi:MAG: sensor histidine kinase [Ilumatobacteraceae bacterium]
MNRFPLVSWFRHHPLAADCILAACLLLIGMGSLWGGAHYNTDARDPNVWASILVVGAAAPIALRRRNPIPVLFAVSACQFVLEINNFESAGWMSIFIALYTVAAHTNGNPRTIAARAFALLTLLLLMAGLAHASLQVGQFISSIVFLIGSYILGDNLQRRRRMVAESAERVAIAARQRDLLAHQQVQDERARLARELHDVVAHSVSLMIIQAGAARRSISSAPLQAEAALHELESTGRHAMDELRRVLGVLRTGDAAGSELAPQPTLSDIRGLVADDHTLDVVYSEVGLPPAEVPSIVGLSLYRLVQEALTNVRKHAGTVKHVTVQITYDPNQVLVQVTDDGRGASAGIGRSVDSSDVGHGLVGMRERMALCGGTVKVGPRPGGGWQVTASAPLGADFSTRNPTLLSSDRSSSDRSSSDRSSSNVSAVAP